MKFSIGDKVVLKHTGEEGHVTAYINKAMVEVDVNGTTFPVYIEELDHPYLRWFTEKKPQKPAAAAEQVPVESQKFKNQRLARGVYLSFLPVFKSDEMEDIVDQLKIYLLNELPQPVKFVYDVKFLHHSEFRHEGTLHEFGHVYLHSIEYADMNDQPRFHWELKDVKDGQMAPAEGVLRIRPAKIFEHINELLQKNEATFSYLLIDDFKPKQKEETHEKFEPPVKPRVIRTNDLSSLAPPKQSIDLHIEQLVDSIKGLSNADIIKIQLDALQRNLHLAIVHHLRHMVIIHGLGKGKLKEEVHKMLRETPEVDRYVNEWHGSYGFGATEVFFKY